MPVSGWDSAACSSRCARESGEQITATHEANPGEVWEESEFWVALSWKIDPDGSLGIRKFFEVAEETRPANHDGRILRLDLRELGPRLPEAAAKEQLTPLAYMRKYGVFKVSDKSYSPRVRARTRSRSWGTTRSEDGETILRNGVPAWHQCLLPCTGFNTPSRRLEFFADDGRVGMGRACASQAVPGRLLARPQARRGRVRSLPNFGCRRSSHAIAGQMALRNLHSNPLWISTLTPGDSRSRPAIS